MAFIMRSDRRIVMVGLVIGLVLVALSGAIGLWLTAWVPTKGKAWLEAQLEQRLPLDVRIGSMRYALTQGLLLHEVSATDPTTATTWFRAPRLKARIGLLTLLIQREVAFRMEGRLIAPCQTDMTVSGRYGLRSQQLLAELASSDIPVEQVIPELRQRLSSLKAGRPRLALRLRWQPGTNPVFTGRLTGTALRVQHGPLQLTSDMIIEGTATPLPAGPAPWSLDLTTRLDRGTLHGLPLVKEASQLSGTIRLVNDTLQITVLRGTTLGSPWEVEGLMLPLAAPSLDLVIRTRLDLAAASAIVPDVAQRWEPRGEADVIAVCRGPLARWPEIEFMADVALRDSSVAIPTSPYRLEHLTGRLEYDHLTTHLTLNAVTGRVKESPVTLQGEARLVSPAQLNLTAETTADLALLNEVLPPEGLLQRVAGSVSLHVDIRGTSSHPTWDGTARFTNTALRVRGIAQAIDGLSGTAHVTDQDISSPLVSFTMDGQPITMKGRITHLATAPHVSGEAQFPNGSLVVNGTVYPDRIALESGELTVGESSLQAQGRVSRLPHQASQLMVTGTVDPADLLALPWIDLKYLEAWQLSGRAKLQLRVSGPLDEWSSLSAQGILQANRLSIHGVPLETVSAELNKDGGMLSLRVTDARLAGGRGSGEFVITQQDEPNRFSLEADVIMADLGQLAAALPAWHERDIRGDVSAHASLGGVWNDRSNLHGQGWLYATGEQLGEIPLLDRVFRGVFGALADRLGLVTLRKAQVTKIGGQWRLAQARIVSDDLQLVGLSGAEPVTIFVRGSVGLDETLDLTIEPKLSEQLFLQAPNTSTLSTTILKVMGGLERVRQLIGRHRITGTLDKPQYKFEVDLDQVLNQTIPSRLEQLLDSLR